MSPQTLAVVLSVVTLQNQVCFILFFCLTALFGLDLICYYSLLCFISRNTEELLSLSHVTLLSLRASLVKPFLISSSPLSSPTVIKLITFAILLWRYHYCWTHQRTLHSFTTHSFTHPSIHLDCTRLYALKAVTLSIASFSFTVPRI